MLFALKVWSTLNEASVSRRVIGYTPFEIEVTLLLGIGLAASTELMVATAASLIVITSLSSRCMRSKAPKKNVWFFLSGPPKVPP